MTASRYGFDAGAGVARLSAIKKIVTLFDARCLQVFLLMLFGPVAVVQIELQVRSAALADVVANVVEVELLFRLALKAVQNGLDS